MYPIKCGFCRHGNPTGSRYCNACGAPLTAEPCPDCGAVNDVMATTCQQCGASLGDGLENEFFLPLPPEGPANLRSALQPAETPTDTAPAPHTAAATGSGRLDNGAHLIAESSPQSGAVRDESLADSPPNEFFLPLPPEAPANPNSPLQPPERMTEADSDGRDTPNDDGLPATAPSASVGSGTFQEGVASRPRWRVSKPAAALVIVVLAVSVYFAYRHFQPHDAAPRPASTGEAKSVRVIPAASEKTNAAPAAAAPTVTAKPGVGGDSPPVLFAPDRGASAETQAKATGGDDARAKGGQIGDPASVGRARPEVPTDTATMPNQEERQAPREAQEAPKASAAGTGEDVRRPSTNVGAGIAQRPPGSGPCTDALAALGLCTQENNQRREP